ncbi:MAG: hypothetical protein JW803_05405 [Endomicrobiales bacterium]|nr:hypothetical protein [Endomicrobiales bacterium]
MRKILISAMVLTAMACSGFAAAKPDTTIAVAEFTGRDVTEADASAITDFFRVGLVKTRSYSVLDRKNMEVILGEQKFQMSGVAEQESAVKLGKMLGVQKMVVGNVTLFDKTYYINVQVVDVEKGVIEASEKASALDKNQLPEKSEALAFRIVALLKRSRDRYEGARIDDQPSTGPTFFKISVIPQVSLPRKNVVHGIGMGLIGSRDNEVHGINGGIVYSRVDREVIGFESAIYSVVHGTMGGAQMSYISKARKVYGVQFGLYNNAKATYGVQAGWINVAEDMNGVQIGIINYTQYIKGVQWGLINIATKNTLLPGMILLNVGF